MQLGPTIPAGIAFQDRPSFQQPRAVEEAAREFEGMLIAYLLKTAREAAQFGGGEDAMTGGQGYLEIAEKQLAQVLASRYTFGFARMILKDVDDVGPARPRGDPP